MGEYDYERWGKVWSDVPHEIWSFLDDQDLAVVSSALDQGTIMGVLLLEGYFWYL